MSDSMIVLTKEKFSKIEARLKHIPDEEKHFRVVINTAPEDRFEVKAYVTFHKKEYFSNETDFTLETALIGVVNELTRMMEKDKEKWEQYEQKNREAKRYGEEEFIGADLEEDTEKFAPPEPEEPDVD